MRRIIILIVSLLFIFSCGEQEDVNKGTAERPELKCLFLPVDAYASKLGFMRGINDIEIILTFKILPRYQDDHENRLCFQEEEFIQKGQRLADTLVYYKYHYLFPAYTPKETLSVKFMYGGVSGPVLISSDKELAGREAGTDLSDIITVSSKGQLQFPDMVLLQDSTHDKGSRPIEVVKSFQDCFPIGIVPMPIPYQNNYRIGFPSEINTEIKEKEATLFFEIPVTGLTLDGTEKTIVFTGSCGSETGYYNM